MSTASSSHLLLQHHPEQPLNFNNRHIHLVTLRYPPILLHIRRRSLTVFYGGTIQFHSARDYAEHEERRFTKMGMRHRRARCGGLRRLEALG